MKTPDPTLMLRYTRDNIIEMYGRLSMNLHGATDQLSDEETGNCLYLDTSRLDHSCQPNAAIYFVGTKAKTFILESGKNERPDFIRNSGLSYLRIAYNVGEIVRQTPAADRRAALKKKYFFDCDCGDCTCKDDLRISPLVVPNAIITSGATWSWDREPLAATRRPGKKGPDSRRRASPSLTRSKKSTPCSKRKTKRESSPRSNLGRSFSRSRCVT